MLEVGIKQQLKNYLEKITAPVAIVAAVDDSAKSKEMLNLLHEIRALSDNISVTETADASVRAPSFTLGRPGENARIRFAGIPLGHEFSSLVLALLQVGGYPPKVSADQVEQIKSLNGEFRFETYISLSCQNCPEVVQALNLLAALNPNVENVMIDGALYQDEVDARQVMAVPSVYLNGQPFGQGRRLDWQRRCSSDLLRLSLDDTLDVHLDDASLWSCALHAT